MVEVVVCRYYRKEGTAAVYHYGSDGRLHPVPDWQTMEYLGNPPVHYIDEETLAATPKGDRLKSVVRVEERRRVTCPECKSIVEIAIPEVTAHGYCHYHGCPVCGHNFGICNLGVDLIKEYVPPPPPPIAPTVTPVAIPAIIRGVYGVNTIEELRGAADLGFNVVCTDAWRQGLMDEAARLGVKVTMTMGPSFLWEPGEPPYTKERIINTVNQWRDHPGLWAWYLSDEPDLWPAGPAYGETFKRTYRLIKQYDTEHPVTFALNRGHWGNVLNWTGYQDGFDILMFDCYPFSSWTTDPEGYMGWYMARLAEFGWSKGRFPVIPIIQANDDGSRSGDRVIWQYNWWKSRLGTEDFICYKYPGGIAVVANLQRQARLLNANVTKWPLPEVITTKTITHECGAKIEYKISSIATKNVPLTCPYDGLSLGVSGLKGSTIIINISEMIAKLQGEIATLDERIAELEAKIEAFRIERDKARKVLGV